MGSVARMITLAREKSGPAWTIIPDNPSGFLGRICNPPDAKSQCCPCLSNKITESTSYKYGKYCLNPCGRLRDFHTSSLFHLNIQYLKFLISFWQHLLIVAIFSWQVVRRSWIDSFDSYDFYIEGWWVILCCLC